MLTQNRSANFLDLLVSPRSVIFLPYLAGNCLEGICRHQKICGELVAKMLRASFGLPPLIALSLNITCAYSCIQKQPVTGTWLVTIDDDNWDLPFVQNGHPAPILSAVGLYDVNEDALCLDYRAEFVERSILGRPAQLVVTRIPMRRRSLAASSRALSFVEVIGQSAAQKAAGCNPSNQ